MKTRLLLLSAAISTAVCANGQSTPSISKACAAAEHRSFDFWLGNWDVYNVDDGKKSAHVRVRSILNGCAIREEYAGVDGSAGESLSSYDAVHKLWRQHWVSNAGTIVSISGDLTSGAMVLVGPEEGAKSSLVRGTWKLEATGVRETGERSQDDGRTWQPWFDLHFRPSAGQVVPTGK
jgi:hypothetical protein